MFRLSAPAAGLRASIITSVPMLLSVMLGRPALAWMGLSAWLVGLADAGGAYPGRATAMAAMTLCGAIGSAIAWLAGVSAWGAVAVIFVAGVLFSMVRVLGNVGAVVGPLLVVFVAIALGDPTPDPALALERAGWVMAGGLLTMGAALALWPVHPYRPVRLAAARCWRTLATSLAELRGLYCAGEKVDDATWNDWTRRTPRHLRFELEASRQSLWVTRAGRAAASSTGDQLHALLSVVDATFAQLVALGHHLDAEHRHHREDPNPEISRWLEAIERRCTQIATMLEKGTGYFFSGKPEASTAPPSSRVFEHLRTLWSLTTQASEVVAASQPGPLPPHFPRWESTRLREDLRRRLNVLRQNLTFESRALRHALRVGTSAAIAVAVTTWLGMAHGAWVTLTTVVILQPSVGATWTRAAQRVAGTVIGAVIGAAIGGWVGHSVATVLFVAAFIFAARSLLSVNYTLFTTFVTPAFILFAQLAGEREPPALERLLASVGGGALAVLSLFAFWPEREREGARAEAAAAVEALRGLVHQVFSPVLGGPPASDAALAEARRRVGLANNNAEDAVQRVLGGRALAERRAIFTLITEVRRLTASVIALVSERAALESSAAAPILRPFVQQLDRSLAGMSAALRGGAIAEERSQRFRLARTERAAARVRRRALRAGIDLPDTVLTQLERIVRQQCAAESVMLEWARTRR